MDSATYEFAEQLYRRTSNSWRAAEAMVPHVFVESGFPIRLSSILELRQIIDTMQEGRAGSIVYELRGLDDNDVKAIATALRRFLDFYVVTFQDRQPLIPVDTMLNAYLYDQRYKAFKDKSQVLEIGAGCAYLPFFDTSRDSIGCYDLIEATQSFYLLQHKVAAFCYGADFQDMAMGLPPSGNTGTLEPSINLVEIDKPVRARLFPWWQAGEAFRTRYNLILSHANLCEMDKTGRDFYIRSAYDALLDDGYFYVRDFGLPRLGKEREEIARTFSEAGFRALSMVLKPSVHANVSMASILYIKEGHPDYDATPSSYEEIRLPLENPTVREMFFMDSPEKPKTHTNQIVPRILDCLRSKI